MTTIATKNITAVMFYHAFCAGVNAASGQAMTEAVIISNAFVTPGL